MITRPPANKDAMSSTCKTLQGGCLCGAVRFSVSAPVEALRACHCTHCQKSSGAGASVNAVLPASAFALTKGAPKHYDDTADSGRILRRFFCGDCGEPGSSSRFCAIVGGSCSTTPFRPNSRPCIGALGSMRRAWLAG